MNRVGSRFLRGSACFACILLIGSGPVLAQSISHPAQADTDARITALNRSLQETRVELAETRAQIQQLRSLLEAMNAKLATLTAAPRTSASVPQKSAMTPAPSELQANSAAGPAPAKISADDWQVIHAEVDQQAQEKVESGSKYRLNLSGLALLTAFGDSGRVDDLDVPTLALPRSPGGSAGSLGASVRQSIIGLAGTGPNLLGARTSADIQVDFFGGLPSGYGAASSGLLRLRLARIRLDWEHTSMTAGLDVPFFSPNAPTSYMSLAVPAFASSGNLWMWAPTIRVEQRFNTSISQFKIEAGILDPSGYATAAAAVRQPTPGESSRQPVYAVRFSANGTRGDRPASVGASGIYFPQRFANGSTTGGWGSILDWRFPLVPHTELSGEFFAGKGLDSFGGVPVPFIQPQEYNNYTQVGAPALARISTFGGWSQLKLSVDSRNEFNVAAGEGARRDEYLALAAALSPPLASLSPRNQMMFVNYIFRPRSDLLLSGEYRRLRTYPLSGEPAIASQIGLAAGFLF